MLEHFKQHKKRIKQFESKMLTVIAEHYEATLKDLELLKGKYNQQR